MRPSFFWHIGLTYLALVLAVLLFFDIYSSRILRANSIRSAEDELSALSSLIQSEPPPFADQNSLADWTAQIARSGVDLSVIDSTGRVLADSAGDARTLGNRSNLPEFQQALAAGTGESVLESGALMPIFVSRAVRYQPPAGPPVVFRFALTQAEIGLEVDDLQRRLLVVALMALGLGSLATCAWFRLFAKRIERLTTFSRRLAQGDFHLLPSAQNRDELSDLSAALNETAVWMDRTIRWLSGERNRASAILRSMVEGVAVVDAQERIVFSNRAFSEILNVSSASMETRPVIEIVRNSTLLEIIRRALQGEEGLQSDIMMGFLQQRTFTITAAPVKSLEAGPSAGPPEDKPSGAVVVLHEVTELRRLERVRQDFVANVSHEFKTPLTAIQGFAETLLAGALNDPNNNRHFLEIIRDHAQRLARLTNDLLKLARIEAGKLELEFLPVRPIELIERCAETTLLKSSWKQIALEVEVPLDLPAVRGDAGLLRDVLQNLLDNAIQYTPSGGRILVSATAGVHEAVIAVADTGIGIPVAEQERIFERFYRVDAARSREAGGTGLGLSIAKHIIEAHGGRLWVTSEVGSGSTFYFSIPLEDVGSLKASPR